MWHQRTDLAAEARQLWQERAGRVTQLPGVRARDYRRRGVAVTQVEILDRQGAEALAKPEGVYTTLDLGDGPQRRGEGFSAVVEALAEELTPLLPEEGPVFVAGLGNGAMTPDAIGPETVKHILVTRHLSDVLPDFRPVAAAAAGVLGTTGMEAAEWVRGMAERVEPAAVIVVDALAARSLARLCATVQLADTGMIPGSGVGNGRMALNRETLGIPVISLGVPTVVEALTLAADLLPEEGDAPAELSRRGRGLFVTPRDVDAQVQELAKILGYGINIALQPGLTTEDLDGLLT